MERDKSSLPKDLERKEICVIEDLVLDREKQVKGIDLIQPINLIKSISIF